MSPRLFLPVMLLTAGLPARADIYGRSEHVAIVGAAKIEVVARLDTGADSSALHAVNVKYFSRDGATWVRFTIDNGSVLAGSRVTLERPVLKDVKVRQKGGGIEHRPLVEVDLCIGARQFRSKLNLSDRTGYTAPLLIGTTEMAQLGSVDEARQFTQEPSCAEFTASMQHAPAAP